MTTAPTRVEALTDLIPDGERTVDLRIDGMTCAACAARLERRLNRLDGVTASVSYAAERAVVTAPQDLKLDDLLNEVERTGFTAAAGHPTGSVATAEGDASSPAGLISTEEADRARVRYLGRRLVVAVVLFAPLCDLSLAFWMIPSLRFPGWQWLLVALALPVVGWAAWPFHRAALINARHGGCTMDTLASMGILASVGWSLYAMFVQDQTGTHVSLVDALLHQPAGAIYLDVGAGVTTFLLAGRFFEAWSRRRTGNVLRAFASVGAKDVTVLMADGVEHRKPVDQLMVGETFVVRPGEKVATDGQVLSGFSAVDCSAMTGEPVPEETGSGDPVIGGTTCLSGRLVVRATHVGATTQLAQMVRLVERAQTEKASVQRLADRISGVFVPAVMTMSALTLVGWLVAGAPGEHAFSAALAVLIIACPCALGLATPTALMVASARAAQFGIFFKGHQSLETSQVIDTVLLDKTGTVTEGLMEVVEWATVPGVELSELLALAGGLEEASEHPIGRAIARRARDELGTLPPVSDFRALPGLGASGSVEGHRVVMGRDLEFQPADPMSLGASSGGEALGGEPGRPSPKSVALEERCAWWRGRGHTVTLVRRDDEVIGAFSLGDAIKPSSARAVARLQALGLRCVLLTGDHAATANAVADAVGIDEVIAGALPEAKVNVVKELQAAGHSLAVVGDGINDGPALVAADLGLAVGSGTDVAVAAADLVLLRDDLMIVPTAIALARLTLRTIHGNYLWAVGYNVAAIPLAAVGLLNPLIAGAAMAFSSAFVVWNSARLRKATPAR